MRFLLDENIPYAAKEALLELGHDVVHVGESSLRGQPDERLIEASNRERRLLVSFDLGLSQAASGLATGLILIRLPKRLSATFVLEMIRAVLSERTESDLEGAVTVLSPGRIRIRLLR